MSSFLFVACSTTTLPLHSFLKKNFWSQNVLFVWAKSGGKLVCSLKVAKWFLVGGIFQIMRGLGSTILFIQIFFSPLLFGLKFIVLRNKFIQLSGFQSSPSDIVKYRYLRSTTHLPTWKFCICNEESRHGTKPFGPMEISRSWKFPWLLLPS